MFRIGERLEASENHPFFRDMSKFWIYNGHDRDLHSVIHPETRAEFSLVLTRTLEKYFKKARPARLENK